MRTALVIGASGDIGFAVAARLLNDGFDVVAHCNSSKERVEKAFSRCVFADLKDENSVKEMFAAVGRVDVLVNCAGISKNSLFTDTSADEWNEIFDVNARGVFLTCREAARKMVAYKAGRIINVSSMWGITGASCEVAYSASKAAVIGLTRALAKELAPSGITVNCVAPGFINTKMNAHLTRDEVEAFRSEIPLERLGTPQDVAGAVSFLASTDAAYITGQVLSVDGGVVI